MCCTKACVVMFLQGAALCSKTKLGFHDLMACAIVLMI